MNGAVATLDRAGVTYRGSAILGGRPVEAVRAVSLPFTRERPWGWSESRGRVRRLSAGCASASCGRAPAAYFSRARRLQVRAGASAGNFRSCSRIPDWALNPRLKVATSIVEPLSILGVGSRIEHRAKAEQILEMVGLDYTLASRYPHELSGGQRQRVSIARALITNPRLVVFDEAVSALDVSVQAQVLNLIKELQASNGFAALFISHDVLCVASYRRHVRRCAYGAGAPSRFYTKPRRSRRLQLGGLYETAEPAP